MIGRTIAHYEVLAKIGEGGMGEVYRARDTKLEREVAIKVLPRDMSGDPERVARFQREARTLASLQHPNIASIYGFEETPEARFLVMELVEGEDLAERLARGPISVGETMEIARQLMEGMEAAHERSIVHRDLKPANIKIDPDGVAKILDFGLARAYVGEVESSESIEQSPTITAAMTQVGTILGTAAYMSPEQAKGRTVDRRADIWAYGVIVWEMLAGEKLFAGDSISDTLAGVLRQEIDDTPLPSDTPTALRRLLKKCLQRDPKGRLQHIGDARIFLDEDDAGAVAVPRSKVGVWRWAALGLGGLSVVLAGLLLRPASDTTSGESSPSLRRWSFQQQREETGTTLTAQVSPDGLSIAFVDGAGLWIRSLDEFEARNIYQGEDCSVLTWSPDSQSIMFMQNHRIFRISPTGGQPHASGVLAKGLSASAASISWDTKDRLVIGTGSTGLLHIPTIGAESEPFLAVGEGETDFHRVAGVPGAKGWIFIVHEQSGDFGRLDLYTPEGERRTILALGSTNIYSIFVDPAGYLLFEREGSNAGIWAAPFSLDRLEVTGAPFLVALNGKGASVSNDGTLVYTRDQSSDEGDLVWVDRAGNLLQTLAEVKTTRPFPTLLPGDQEILLPILANGGRDLWSFDSTTGIGRQIYQSQMSEETVTTSRDGSTVYTYSVSEAGYTTYRFPLRSPSQVEAVVPGILCDARDDLGFLYYSRIRPGNFIFDICELPLDDLDAEPRVLVASDAIDWGVATSPDGKYMAYGSQDSGNYEVYLTLLPDAQSRWQISSQGGHWPRWRSDGREIFYAENDGIYSASFDDQSGVRLGAPELLFEYPQMQWSDEWPNGFDVDDEGERFLLVGRGATASDTPTEVIVVENWAREFETQ